MTDKTTNSQMGLFEDSSKTSTQKSMTNNNMNLENSQATRHRPLAYRARPSSFEDYQGQEHIFDRFPFLKEKNFPSLILWGPPGTGKTTLAGILATNSGKEIYNFNAVLGGVADLKKLIKNALEVRDMFQKEAIIFIDEIHRFNKSQQDALLPYVEAGDFTLIGATTENPRAYVNRALISRTKVIPLKKLEEAHLVSILKRANEKEGLSIPEDILQTLADYAGGDARNALSTLENLSLINTEITKEVAKKLILENARAYDRNQDRHYDVISAFIKSMRGSDPNAAILWLAVMIDGGEDPMFIARRLVIFASEDIGNADPQAIQVATSAMTSVEKVGMPEARIPLAQAVTYLASTVKSNAAYKSIDAALEYVRENETIEVPTHLRNHHPDKKNYKYPHAYQGNYIPQKYTIDEIPNFYEPTQNGFESKVSERLARLKSESLN